MGLIFILLLALALRLAGIFSLPFSAIEYQAWAAAHEPAFLDFLRQACVHGNLPPLPLIPLWFLCKISDASWLLRLASVLAGLGSVLLFYKILRRYLELGEAQALALLLALMPLNCYLSWELGSYNSIAFVSLLLLDEALLLSEAPLRSSWRLQLWSACLALSSYLALGLLLGLLLAFRLYLHPGHPAYARLKTALAQGLLWVFPFWPFMLRSLFWAPNPELSNAGLATAMLYSIENFSVAFWTSPFNQLVAALVFGVGVLAFLVSGGESPLFSRPKRALSPRLKWLLLSLLLFPLAFALLVTLLGEATYNDRALQLCGFAWLLMAGLGALSLTRAFRIALLSAFAALEILALLQYATNDWVRRIDYQAPWAEIGLQWQPGDLILHAYESSGFPFEYFAAREAEAHPGQALKENYLHARSLDYAAASPGPAQRFFASLGLPLPASPDPLDLNSAQLAPHLKSAKRIWYVAPPESSVQRSWLEVPNHMRSGQGLEAPFSFAAEDWLREAWRFQSEGGNDDVKIYLYVPTK